MVDTVAVSEPPACAGLPEVADGAGAVASTLAVRLPLLMPPVDGPIPSIVLLMSSLQKP